MKSAAKHLMAICLLSTNCDTRKQKSKEKQNKRKSFRADLQISIVVLLQHTWSHGKSHKRERFCFRKLERLLDTDAPDAGVFGSRASDTVGSSDK